jgi:hypothetical protein
MLFPQTNLSDILDAFKDYPGKMDLGCKYAIAHMYAITDPPYIKSYMSQFSSKLETWLTLRNDDIYIYSFRWGNPAFTREFLLSIPERSVPENY